MAPGQKSIVWLFFKKSADNKFAVCALCNQQLKYFVSTSNLKQHIIRKHNIQYNEELRKEKETPLSNQTENDSLQRIVPDEGVFSNSQTENEVATTSQIEFENTAESSKSVAPVFSASTSTAKTTEVPTHNIASSSKRNNSSDLNKEVPTNKRRRQLKLFGGRCTNELTEFEKNDMDLSLLKMIAIDYQPLSIVENPGFLEYSKKLNALYSVPSRHVLTKRILPETYSEAAGKLKSILNTVEYVSVTTDIWQSDSNKSYLSLTCHFINNAKFQSYVLGTRELTHGSHTGKNIAEDLLTLINEWDIENKIVTFVSDNGANIKNAITEHLHYHHHPCVAHTLNLSMREALIGNVELNKLIIKCKNLVSHFKHSGLATSTLKKCQEQMGLPVIKVKQAVDTRWNSILIMLERLLEIKDPLTVALTNLPSAPEHLDASEWVIVTDCVPVLKPLELLTTELSGEKYITMSLITPLIRGLQFHLRSLNPHTDIGLWLQKNLIEIVSRRLGSLESNKIVAKSTFLDPRLKKTAFGLEENAKKTQCWITDEIAVILATKLETNSQQKGTQAENTDVPLAQNNTNKSLWVHFDQKLAEVTTKTTPNTTATLCVRQYLELPHIERSANPLEFWEKHKHMMPELYRLHKKYLCLPATSVPSERLFSKAGQVTNVKRSRLLPKNLDMILFLNSLL